MGWAQTQKHGYHNSSMMDRGDRFSFTLKAYQSTHLESKCITTSEPPRAAQGGDGLPDSQKVPTHQAPLPSARSPLPNPPKMQTTKQGSHSPSAMVTLKVSQCCSPQFTEAWGLWVCELPKLSSVGSCDMQSFASAFP